jgi:hypothetical protein
MVHCEYLEIPTIAEQGAGFVLVQLSLVEQRLDAARAVLADTATEVAASVGVSRQTLPFAFTT